MDILTIFLLGAWIALVLIWSFTDWLGKPRETGGKVSLAFKIGFAIWGISNSFFIARVSGDLADNLAFFRWLFLLLNPIAFAITLFFSVKGMHKYKTAYVVLLVILFLTNAGVAGLSLF
jgi:hypothetical protein